MNVQGTWTLVVQNSVDTGHGHDQRLVADLPEAAADQRAGRAGQRRRQPQLPIFTLSPTDALSSQAWTAVGGRPRAPTRPARSTPLRWIPSDPSGNTVYVGGASGGIWKTTDFLTTNPAGPTWVPLTNFGPNAAINIASITIFPRNDDPNQSIIIAATGGDTSGQYATDAPGVGFLISTNGGATWNLDDSTDNVSRQLPESATRICPSTPPARDRKFVGTTAYQVTVDPELTPNGQVIIYAALSGTNGGIWRSENTGQTWTQVLDRQRDRRRPGPEQRPRSSTRRTRATDGPGQPPDRLRRDRGRRASSSAPTRARAGP